MKFVYILVFLAMAATSQAQNQDQNGKTYELVPAKGSWTVIDFGASWCKPCLKSLPKLQALSEQRSDIRFFVVSVDETEAGWRQLIKRSSLTVPVIWDRENHFASKYRPTGMPMLYLIDPSGKVVYSHLGSSQSKWDHFLEVLGQHVE